MSATAHINEFVLGLRATNQNDDQQHGQVARYSVRVVWTDSAETYVGFATCPMCHTADPTMTNIALGGGADWHCSRCGQRWDTIRLATVAAYAVWLSEHTDSFSSDSHATTAGSDV